MSLRKLKHHEQKLLKKVDFLQWKSDQVRTARDGCLSLGARAASQARMPAGVAGTACSHCCNHKVGAMEGRRREGMLRHL
jgi:hypothetical protein